MAVTKFVEANTSRGLDLSCGADLAIALAMKWGLARLGRRVFPAFPATKPCCSVEAWDDRISRSSGNLVSGSVSAGQSVLTLSGPRDRCVHRRLLRHCPRSSNEVIRNMAIGYILVLQGLPVC